MEAMEKPEMECRQILKKRKNGKMINMILFMIVMLCLNILIYYLQKELQEEANQHYLNLLQKFYLIRILKQILKEIN